MSTRGLMTSHFRPFPHNHRGRIAAYALLCTAAMTDQLKPVVGSIVPLGSGGSGSVATKVALAVPVTLIQPKKAPPVFSADLSYDDTIITPHDTILIWGDTGSGKTPLCGEMILDMWQREKKRARYYTGDRGGLESIKHITDRKTPAGVPLVEIEAKFGDPWIWWNHAVKGDTYNKQTKRWEKGLKDDIGIWVFEGLSSMADDFMSWMKDAARDGKNIGGEGAFSFEVEGGGEKMKIGSSNRAHYGVAQAQTKIVGWNSQRLPGTLIWTAVTQRSEDENKQQIVGPATAGKANVTDWPRWLKYTFHIAIEVPATGGFAQRVLYLDYKRDIGSGNAICTSNARLPVVLGQEAQLIAAAPVDFKVSPASLVKAMAMIKGRQQAAVKLVQDQYGLL